MTGAVGRLRSGVANGRTSLRDNRTVSRALAIALILFAAILPFFFGQLSGFIDDATVALAYVVMALGLNIVVGFAGLLDLGYVAFYAIGAYATGWFASQFYGNVSGGKGVHVLVGDAIAKSPLSGKPIPGIHLNWILVAIAAAILCAIAGMIIGLPTLRLRGDYIAIVTLAFGEIIGVLAINGDEIHIKSYALTGGRKGITPIDPIDLPGLKAFDPATNLRPWYWTALVLVLIILFVNIRLRDSRLGRAWVAVREDEVAAASMGVPLVRTKLLAYATGAAFGGVSGAFIGSYLNQVNADQFAFSFSIFVLAMVILGGLGSIWGVVLGAITLSFINSYFIPDVFNSLPSTFGLDFDLTQLSFGIFGFLLVVMMVLRPQGLLPERRREAELTEGVGTDETLYEAQV